MLLSREEKAGVLADLFVAVHLDRDADRQEVDAERTDIEFLRDSVRSVIASEPGIAQSRLGALNDRLELHPSQALTDVERFLRDLRGLVHSTHALFTYEASPGQRVMFEYSYSVSASWTRSRVLLDWVGLLPVPICVDRLGLAESASVLLTVNAPEQLTIEDLRRIDDLADEHRLILRGRAAQIVVNSLDSIDGAEDGARSAQPERVIFGLQPERHGLLQYVVTLFGLILTSFMLLATRLRHGGSLPVGLQHDPAIAVLLALPALPTAYLLQRIPSITAHILYCVRFLLGAAALLLFFAALLIAMDFQGAALRSGYGAGRRDRFLRSPRRYVAGACSPPTRVSNKA